MTTQGVVIAVLVMGTLILVCQTWPKLRAPILNTCCGIIGACVCWVWLAFGSAELFTNNTRDADQMVRQAYVHLIETREQLLNGQNQFNADTHLLSEQNVAQQKALKRIEAKVSKCE